MVMPPAEWIPGCSARFPRPRTGVCGALLAFFIGVAPGFAAEENAGVAGSQPQEGVEEIVVEGTGVDDSLQESAISGTHFDAQELRTLRIQNIQDMANYTPNLEIATAFAASNPTIFIRGIGLKDYNANAAGAVGVYLDGINLNAPAIQLFHLFDTESVDVRRGPQGSLNGRNSTAGAILIRSRRPGDEFGAEANLTYGNYDTLQFQGSFDVPLVPDVLLSRFAFTANFRDGITENQCANWDPQEHEVFADRPGRRGMVESYRTSSESLREEYDKDLQADSARFRNLTRYTIQSTNRVSRQNDLNAAGLPLQANSLLTDGACITNGPGFIVTERGAALPDAAGPAGSFHAFNVPQLEDFQGLKRWTNNVENWAARGVFVYRPPQIVGMEWVANFHGGQNLSDSRHLQGLQAEPKAGAPGFDAVFMDGVFNEAQVARQTGFEGLANLSGVDARGGLTGDRADNPFRGYYNRDGLELIDTWGLSLLGEWELENVHLLSLTGYEWYERLVEDEGDASPVNTFPADYRDSSWQFSQEFRVSGESGLDGPQYSWVAGLFFLYEELEAFNLFPDTRGYRIEQSFDSKLYSAAPFLNGTWQVSEALSLEAGVRYSYEHKDFTLDSSSVTTSAEFRDIPGETQAQTWDAPTGEVTLRYEPTWDVLAATGNERLMLYAKYARGFKGGHFNAGITSRNNAQAQTLGPVEPEHIHAAEVGFKTDWWDERLRFNLSGFRYWYKDMQVFDYANGAGELPFQKLLNADARVWGLEAEVNVEPIDHLVVNVGFGWLDSKYGEFEVETTIYNPRGQPEVQINNWKGNNTVNAPKINASGMVSYEWSLNRWGALIPHYGFSYRSKLWFDPKQIDPISQPAYWLHNARLSYRFPNETVEVSFWVQNFLDEEYKVDAFDVTREYDTILEAWGDPRTYGVSVWYGF